MRKRSAVIAGIALMFTAAALVFCVQFSRCRTMFYFARTVTTPSASDDDISAAIIFPSYTSRLAQMGAHRNYDRKKTSFGKSAAYGGLADTGCCGLGRYTS